MGGIFDFDVDLALSCLDAELGHEFTPDCSHRDILPACPRVSLLGAYFFWGTTYFAGRAIRRLEGVAIRSSRFAR
jgi:hypothetical protein